MIQWKVERLTLSRDVGSVSTRATVLNEQRINEDRTVYIEVSAENNSYMIAAVIDGAAPLHIESTSPKRLTPGALVAEIIEETIIHGDPHSPLKEMLLEANKRIRQISLQYGVDYAKPETIWAAAVSLIRLDSYGRLEYVHIADTVILVARLENVFLLSRDQVEPFDREVLRAIQEARKNVTQHQDALRDQVRSLMQEQKAKANSMDGLGYGAINGMADSQVEQYLINGTRQIDQHVEFIALLTDGMLPPSDAMGQQPDWLRIANILRQNGLVGLASHTRQIERNDPLLEKPRVKLHDDASGILIRIRHQKSSCRACR